MTPKPFKSVASDLDTWIQRRIRLQDTLTKLQLEIADVDQRLAHELSELSRRADTPSPNSEESNG